MEGEKRERARARAREREQASEREQERAADRRTHAQTQARAHTQTQGMLMLEHERDSFPALLWANDRGWALFHAALRLCSIAIAATYILEMLLTLITQGVLFYFSSIWQFLDGSIAIVCILLLPTEAKEFKCLSQPSEVLDINSCYGAEDDVWAIFRSWRLLRFLKVLSTFPALAKQLTDVAVSMRPVLGILALLALLLLIYIGIGVNIFGGLLMQEAERSQLLPGSSVFVTVPIRQSTQDGQLYVAKEAGAIEKVPSIILYVNTSRPLPYYLDIRTGFSNFATNLDPKHPQQWGAASSVAAADQISITHIVPRSNYNTFYFAMTCVLQVAFNKQWSRYAVSTHTGSTQKCTTARKQPCRCSTARPESRAAHFAPRPATLLLSTPPSSTSGF